jgi:uncharacterized RDD family membrane protein YckC
MRLSLRRPNPRIGTEADVVGRRVVAFFVDQLVVFALLVGVGSSVLGVAGAVLGASVELGVTEAPLDALAGGANAETAIAVGAALFAVAWSVTALTYYTAMEGGAGATVGKMLLGLVVVRADGSPVGYRTAFVRTLLRAVDSQPGLYLLGVGSMLLSDRRQRLGDRAAGTVVVAAERPADPPSDATAGTPT